MKERPILFSAPMVLALLAGRKTQTRRIVRVPEVVAVEQDDMASGERWDYTQIVQRMDGAWRGWLTEYPDEGSVDVRCPHGVPGDRLWVRETWRAWERETDGLDHIWYRADDAKVPIPNTRAAADAIVGRFDKWRPSIFLPRWASRITLEITGVRAQRLQQLDEAAALAEGFLPHGRLGALSARDHFALLWDEINGAGSWEANPWTWVLTFKVVQP